MCVNLMQLRVLLKRILDCFVGYFMLYSEDYELGGMYESMGGGDGVVT